METRPPLVPYYPELMQDTYESILAQYLKVPDFKIPPYPGIRFNVKDNMLEIDMHIQRSQVHPTNKALWEYIYEHYPKAPFRISLWDWRRDESVSPDPTLLHPEIIQDLCANFKFLYKHISQWCEVRFDLPLLGLVAYQSSKDIARISDMPKFLRKLEVKEMQSATSNAKLPNALNSLLDRLWNYMASTNLRFEDTTAQDFDRQTFPGLPYGKLSELRLDTICSAGEVIELLHLCPTLRKAAFMHLIGPKPGGNTMAICANLRHLILENDNLSFDKGPHNSFLGMICEVLGRLNAPALKELSLGYEDIWSASGFDRFIETSKCELAKLEFLGIKMSDKDLYHALGKNPQLQELTVHGQSPTHHGEHYDILFTSHILERMVHHGNWNRLCPHLQRLEVTYSSIQSGSFRRLVRSPILLRNINLIKARGMNADDFRALEQLARNGLSIFHDGLPAGFPTPNPPQPQWSYPH